MNGKDIINLQEAYLQVYSQPEISEEAEIAAEYFYEQGLNEEDVEDLIEELGVEEFNELVYEILDVCELTEARRSGRIEPVTKTGKSVGQLRGGARTAAITRLRREKAARRASETEASSRPSGMKAALRSQAATAVSSKPKPPASPAQTKSKMGGLIGWAMEKGKKDIEQTKRGLQTLGKTWQDVSDTKPAQYLRVAAKQASREAPGVGRAIGGAAGRIAASIPAVRSTYRAGQRLGKAMRAEDFELWVNTLLDEGYDLSDYTWDDMMEIYEANVVMSVKSPEGKSRALNVTKAPPSRNLQGKERLDAARTMRQKAVDTRFKDQGKVKQFRRRHGLPEEHEFILSHLLDEGYAESLESAQAIINSMSEEWVSEILDEVRGFGGYIPKGGTTYSGHYDDEHPGSKGSGKSDGGIKHYYARGTESGLSMSPSQRANLAAKRARREGTPEGRRRANKILTRITSAH